ncbi:hypothetical protein PSAB6_270144 [Paraburkholderia sabiae]|nr:hypothetical protein PSAB6_270144 [Paraburkholderia sabiae]
MHSQRFNIAETETIVDKLAIQGFYRAVTFSIHLNFFQFLHLETLRYSPIRNNENQSSAWRNG